MSNQELAEQKNFYNQGYEKIYLGEVGFPDLKIVDYNPAITDQKILNIGGGNSADLWFLAKSNEVYALDASSVGVEQAREHNIKAEFDNVEEALPFAADFFDIVVLKDILEHIYNPFELLQEAKRIVKPSGYIIISLPNHFYLPFRLKILFGQNLIWKTLMHNHKKDFAEWNYMHVRFFTWSGVKKMIKAAGLKITKTYWDFGTLAHYSDPLMYEYAFKANNKKITTRQQQLMYKVLLPAYKIFNLICPRAFRKWLVSLCPGLLCAGFYLRVEK